jgi:hypothetical protein
MEYGSEESQSNMMLDPSASYSTATDAGRAGRIACPNPAQRVNSLLDVVQEMDSEAAECGQPYEGTLILRRVVVYQIPFMSCRYF